MSAVTSTPTSSALVPFNPRRSKSAYYDLVYQDLENKVQVIADTITGAIFGKEIILKGIIKNSHLYDGTKEWVAVHFTTAFSSEFKSITYHHLREGLFTRISQDILEAALPYVQAFVIKSTDDARRALHSIPSAESLLPELLLNTSIEELKPIIRNPEHCELSSHRENNPHTPQKTSGWFSFWKTAHPTALSREDRSPPITLNLLLYLAELNGEKKIVDQLEYAINKRMDIACARIVETATNIFAIKAEQDLLQSIDIGSEALCAIGSTTISGVILGNLAATYKTIISAAQIVASIVPTTLYCGYLGTQLLFSSKKNTSPLLNRLFTHLNHKELRADILKKMTGNFSKEFRTNTRKQLQEWASSNDSIHLFDKQDSEKTMDKLLLSIETHFSDGSLKKEIDLLLRRFHGTL
ncbi:MAG: hypothetical protein ACI9S8_000702 [Chlamydiales bacterium]|jgi:hypothetical protein